jgi:nitrite reductase/ring-hydroxylating ferredoxin subunit
MEESMAEHRQPDRRGFLTKALAVICGGLATVVPLGAGLWAFLDPLRRRGGGGRFIPVTELAAIPADGVPRRFAVVAERKDAWTGYGAEPIGAVWLRREPGADTVRALSATCPHAGCGVDMAPGGGCFRCPCHNSEFTFAGDIKPPSPSPRGMDELECRVEGGAVAIRWQKFRAGVAAKVAQA